MFLLEWTASDLLMILLAGVAMIGAVLWIVPAARVPLRRQYSPEEITSYDSQVPRYFLAAALALAIGGAHILVKNIPGFWNWLWEAGYGGHLFRDLSNSHIIIVGGGTVLLTGLTWYLLPRLANRPLYSNSLASASFWFTIVGVFGFYLSWLVLGLVEGNLVRGGMDYLSAKELIGAAHRVPTRMTASIMGVGYWTYVLNVFLTILAARNVEHKPDGHLLKFVGVSAAALFVGTVQGVIQVLPANADWIHAAGKFGEFVDPISHAHINLVTGMMVSLAALLVYFAPRMGGKPISHRVANRMFWSIVPGSLVFYLTFLFAGLVLGNAANGYGGIHSPALTAFFSRNLGGLLAIAGSLMLVGFWVYFVTLWGALGLRAFGARLRSGAPAAFWIVSSGLLVVGTFQGLLQAIPATSRLLTTAEEIPNVHAQLNMIGGVLLALMAIAFLLVPDLLGRQVSPQLARQTLVGVAGGISAYYLTTLIVGLARYRGLQQGLRDAEAAARLGPIAPAALMLAAVPLFFGFLAFGRAVLRATPEYRAGMVKVWRQAPVRFSGPMPDRVRRIPASYVLGMEFAGGLFGWPGMGWLFAGQVMPAIALLMIGPAIAWALLPMLFSPFTNTVLARWNWHVLLVWLPGSALVSTALLGGKLRRLRKPHSQAAASAALPVAEKMQLRRKPRIPRRLAFGTGFVMLALFSVPVIPLLAGIPQDTGQQQLAAALPDRASGAYLQVDDGQQQGALKLFAWSFPLDEPPQETLAIAPQALAGFLIQQKGLDNPDAYRLYHLDDGDAVALDARIVSFQTQMTLAPRENLEPGDYMLDVPSGGMFAGREYYYFRVDPTAATPPLYMVAGQASELTTTASATTGVRSDYLLELFPLSASLFSGLAALTMLRRMRDKLRPHEAAWALAFAMFSIAAGVQVAGDLFGWTAALARLYYVLGATLVVGWLGLGTWLLLVRSPGARQAALWGLLLISGFAVGQVSLAPVEGSLLSASGWHALQKPVALTVVTIGLNSVGTLMLVGGALYSAWNFWRQRIQRQRMVGLVLLAVGTLVVAAGGSLTRLGHDQYLYLAMSVGVGLMYWGYRRTIDVYTPPREHPPTTVVS